MKGLFILIFSSLLFSAEMEVDGNLKVTGTVESVTIDSLEHEIVTLKLIIAQLQAQIAQLEAQMVFLGQDLNNADCFGIVGGDAVLDNCGTCDNDSSNDCLQDCSGEWGGASVEDVCGTCGGSIAEFEECNFVLSFDGIDDYVEIPEINAGSYYHLECKIKLVEIENDNDFYTIIAHPTINELGVNQVGNIIQYHKMGETPPFIATGVTLLNNVWTSLKLTRNNDEYKFYLDESLGYEGIRDWSDDIYNTIGSWQANDDNISLREPWSGEIESLIIYNGTDTLSYYKFNGSFENTLYDHSGNENHGTIYGATWVARE